MNSKAKVVVVGAGIIGISAAYHLAVRQKVEGVVILDPLPPLSLTSDKSTECYRNWWPNQPMVSLMNRSIDLFEEDAHRSDNIFNLSRHGYLYVTADPNQQQSWVEQSPQISAWGAGELRTHQSPTSHYLPNPKMFAIPSDSNTQTFTGCDLFLDPESLLPHFPFLTPKVIGGIHARRAGWLSAQQYGTWMLEQAKSKGAILTSERVEGFETNSEKISAVQTRQSVIECEQVVVAAGPLVGELMRMVEVEVPVFCELHLKIAFSDHQEVIPRNAPMVIWSDPQIIPWSNQERKMLTEVGRGELVEQMPSGCHFRPEGGEGSNWILALWEFSQQVSEPVFPIPEDPLYGEVVLRGLETMVPGLGVYRDRLPPMKVDGGYYTKTKENRPLIGPVGPKGMVIAGAVSGFGVMVSAAVGELAAAHIMGDDLPDYGPSFMLERYKDPNYLDEISANPDTGQI